MPKDLGAGLYARVIRLVPIGSQSTSSNIKARSTSEVYELTVDYGDVFLYATLHCTGPGCHRFKRRRHHITRRAEAINHPDRAALGGPRDGVHHARNPSHLSRCHEASPSASQVRPADQCRGAPGHRFRALARRCILHLHRPLHSLLLRRAVRYQSRHLQGLILLYADDHERGLNPRSHHSFHHRRQNR